MYLLRFPKSSSHSYFFSWKVELTPDEKQVLEAWQAGDMALYRHFAEKFETMVMIYQSTDLFKNLYLDTFSGKKYLKHL